MPTANKGVLVKWCVSLSRYARARYTGSVSSCFVVPLTHCTSVFSHSDPATKQYLLHLNETAVQVGGLVYSYGLGLMF
jgi:hypothetical protein